MSSCAARARSPFPEAQTRQSFLHSYLASPHSGFFWASSASHSHARRPCLSGMGKGSLSFALLFPNPTRKPTPLGVGVCHHWLRCAFRRLGVYLFCSKRNKKEEAKNGSSSGIYLFKIMLWALFRLPLYMLGLLMCLSSTSLMFECGNFLAKWSTFATPIGPRTFPTSFISSFSLSGAFRKTQAILAIAFSIVMSSPSRLE